MFDEFAKNIIGSRTGDPGNIYDNYVASKVNSAPAATAASQAAVQAKVDESERQNALQIADAEQKIADQKEADAKDPNKATMTIKPDGSGYDFRDGTGKPLNINQFSLLTGKRPDELLADSDNPQDQRFVQDYTTLKAISNAWINGDNETLQKYRAADPEKFNTLISNYKSPAEMVAAFKNYYSDYYGDTVDKNTDTPNFTTQNLVQPSKSAPAPSTSIDQTLAPSYTPPTLAHTAIGSNPGVWAAEHIPILNRLTGRTDELNRQKEKLAANPWSTYHSALTGR